MGEYDLSSGRIVRSRKRAMFGYFAISAFSESESGRVMLELGPVGFFFVYLGRVALALFAFRQALRLRPDYAPTGFKGAGVEHRAVPGHRFGLGRSPEDKRALLAFLRTL
jgi:hypothetical protein